MGENIYAFGNAVFAVDELEKHCCLHNEAKVSEIESSVRPHSALILIPLKNGKWVTNKSSQMSISLKASPHIFQENALQFFSGRSVKNSFKNFMLV